MGHDLRYALRTLRKAPGFTAVAVLALALGIGANTAIFSMLDYYMLRPLPYPDSERLEIVGDIRNPVTRTLRGPTYLDYDAWKARSRVIDEVAAYRYISMNLADGAEPELVQGLAVTASFFRLLGAKPALGPAFLAEEDSPGGTRAVILTYGFWQRRFAGNPAALGQTIRLSGQPHTIVGVMPASFRYGDRQQQFLTPLAMRADPATRQSVIVVLKLGAGVSRAVAEKDLASISRGLEQEGSDARFSVGLVSLHAQMNHLRHSRPPLLVLMAAVGFVLLIACANVANLLLSRAVARGREIAIRTTLGATRWQLLRQMLTESATLAIAGGALGLALGSALAKFLMATAPSYMLPIEEFSISTQVLGYTLLVTLATGFLFGLVPAIHALKTNLNETLKEGGRGTSASRGRGRLRSALVVAEVAPALILLIGAGLLIKSFARMQQVDLGFRPESVLAADLVLPAAKYPAAHQRAAFFTEALERIERVPGVAAAGAASRLGYGPRRSFRKTSDPPFTPGRAVHVGYRTVTPGYFRAMRIPLRGGRYFTPQDREGALRVGIINETMARNFWPGEDPLGQAFELGGKEPALLTVVGVVGDDKLTVFGNASPDVFAPQAQDPPSFMTLTVHAPGDPTRLVSALASEVRALDSEQPLGNVRTMERFLEDSVAPQRLTMHLLAIFAGVALTLAALGLYGVISYAVSQRTHELGLRTALGATRGDLLRLVVGQGMVLTAIGCALGLAGAFAVTRLMSVLLFGVSARDTAIFTGVPFVLIVVALLASYIPGRRAARVDPIVALRHE